MNRKVEELRILLLEDVPLRHPEGREISPADCLGSISALGEISRGRSRAYDPEVADACIRLFGETGFDFRS